MSASISFILTNYNYKDFIEGAISSCLKQIQTNCVWELIIVDDGSDDGSLEIIKNYQSCAKILHTKNFGIEKAFNAALKLSAGEYVVRVDADDFLELDFLKKTSPFLNENVDIIYGDYYQLDLRNASTKPIILPSFDQSEIIGRGDFLATGTIFRKKLFEEFLMYQENVVNCGLENFELVVNCMLHEKIFMKINDHLFYYRLHDNNMSVRKQKKIRDYGTKFFARLGLGEYRIGPYHPYFGDKT